MAKTNKESSNLFVLSSAEVSPNLKPTDGWMFSARDRCDGSIWLYKQEPRLLADGRWILDGEVDLEDAVCLLAYDIPAIEEGRLYYLGFAWQTQRGRKWIDSYECGNGLQWTDGWRWLAMDGDRLCHLFDLQPRPIGQGRDLVWTNSGRKVRTPFGVKNLSTKGPMYISFEQELLLKQSKAVG